MTISCPSARCHASRSSISGRNRCAAQRRSCVGAHRRPRPRLPRARPGAGRRAPPSRRRGRRSPTATRSELGRASERGAANAPRPPTSARNGPSVSLRAIVPSKSNAATFTAAPATASSRHSGRRRNTARGTWRSADITIAQLRRRPHRVGARGRARRRSPSATASGSVASGAASIPSVIFVCTKPGRTTTTRTPAALEAVAEALAERVEPGLARPVDEVRSSGPARRRPTRARRSVPWPCRAHRLRQRHEHRDRAGEVGLDDADAPRAASRSARSWSPRTPNATSARSMSPNAAEHVVARTRRGCRGRARRTRCTRPSSRRAASELLGRGCERLGVPTREDDGPAPAPDQGAGGGERDVRAAAEDEGRLAPSRARRSCG